MSRPPAASRSPPVPSVWQHSPTWMPRALPPSSSIRIPEPPSVRRTANARSEEHTSELQSRGHLVCRLLLEKKKPAVLRHIMGSKTAISANEPAHLALRLQALHETVGPALAFDLQLYKAIDRDSSPYSALQR